MKLISKIEPSFTVELTYNELKLISELVGNTSGYVCGKLGLKQDFSTDLYNSIQKIEEFPPTDINLYVTTA